MNQASTPRPRRPFRLFLAVLPAAVYAVVGLAGFLEECRRLDEAFVEAYGPGYDANTGLLAFGGLVQLVLVTSTTQVAGLLVARSSHRIGIPSAPAELQGLHGALPRPDTDGSLTGMDPAPVQRPA